MKDVILSYSDLSGSICATIAHDALEDSIVRVCNYNEFSSKLNEIIEISKKDKIRNLYIFSFVLRKYHISKIVSACDYFEKIIYVSHNQDQAAVEELSKYSWFEVVEQPDSEEPCSSAMLALYLFNAPTDIWFDITYYASIWTMHDLESNSIDSDIKAIYVARTLNDAFTDISKQATGVIRTGRYFQLISSFLKTIGLALVRRRPSIVGRGRFVENLIYDNLIDVYSSYANKFTPDNETTRMLVDTGVILQTEIALSSNAQRMSLLAAAVASATITYEGSSSSEVVEIIGTRVYLPKSKVNMSVLSHLLHTFNLIDVAAVIYPGSKVELRANKLCAGVDVAQIASNFGGGGQRATAGFSITQRGNDIAEVRQQITSLITRQIIEESSKHVA